MVNVARLGGTDRSIAKLSGPFQRLRKAIGECHQSLDPAFPAGTHVHTATGTATPILVEQLPLDTC
jgi:hypothetical protein